MFVPSIQFNFSYQKKKARKEPKLPRDKNQTNKTQNKIINKKSLPHSTRTHYGDISIVTGFEVI